MNGSVSRPSRAKLPFAMVDAALSCGAEDLHGTIIGEHIFRMAVSRKPR